MKITNMIIPDLKLIEPEPREDFRGEIARFFCQTEYQNSGIAFNLTQAYQSWSKLKHTLRGLHYQRQPKAEDKLIQCLRGVIFDVALDLRPKSPTYGRWASQILDADNQKLFFVPKGFAHGFMTLTDNCMIQCLSTTAYSPDYEAGIRWNDQRFMIKWPSNEPILSDKDKGWPLTN